MSCEFRTDFIDLRNPCILRRRRAYRCHPRYCQDRSMFRNGVAMRWCVIYTTSEAYFHRAVAANLANSDRFEASAPHSIPVYRTPSLLSSEEIASWLESIQKRRLSRSFSRPEDAVGAAHSSLPLQPDSFFGVRGRRRPSTAAGGGRRRRRQGAWSGAGTASASSASPSSRHFFIISIFTFFFWLPVFEAIFLNLYIYI